MKKMIILIGVAVLTFSCSKTFVPNKSMQVQLTEVELTNNNGFMLTFKPLYTADTTTLYFLYKSNIKRPKFILNDKYTIHFDSTEKRKGDTVRAALKRNN